jgi:hypothetical protein
LAHLHALAEGQRMTAVEQPCVEPDEDEAQLWRCVELDDEVVEQLRRLLFGQHAAPVKND